jgi:KDO2-lipid IV(A) lauroyltransferase
MAGDRSLKLTLTGIGYLAAWRIARLAPERTVGRVFDALSLRSWRKNARRRETVRHNLLPVIGDGPALDEAVRDAFVSYGRYWMETFRMEDLSSDALTERFGIDGEDVLRDTHAAGRGGVLATPHLGNWDAGGRWVAERWPLTVVVEVLKPRMLFDRFVEHRRGLGMTIIPLVRGADATGQCISKIRDGEYVALVSDRDLSGTGVRVRMFGRETKMPPGPAVLALRAGVPLIPACIYQRPGGRWHAWVMEPINGGMEGETPENVALLTQRLAESFERLIAREPSQWHAFSRLWLEADRPASAPRPGRA